ncbi:hypothetical protein GCM10022393_14020 [Aquimarina addita]|uniref:Uncharacterized protein n=2 Tax=Aquimarina addita TaxID=870485 RepID=A0ABP7XF78_9FLAO
MGEEISSMLGELHSYKCEPCTPDMYEQYRELNGNGRELKQSIDTTRNLVKGSVDVSKNIREKVDGIVEAYEMFQRNLSSYLTEAIIHH